MNRRSFLTRVTTAIAAVPVLRPLVARAKPEPVPLPAQPVGSITFILGKEKMGKSTLVEELARDCVRRQECPSIFDSHAQGMRWKEWRDNRLDTMSYCRMQGHQVFVTYTMNRIAEGYGAGWATIFESAHEPHIADTIIVVEGKSFFSDGDKHVMAWRCRSLKNRFGPSNEQFTYLKMGDRFMRVQHYTDGASWANFS